MGHPDIFQASENGFLYVVNLEALHKPAEMINFLLPYFLDHKVHRTIGRSISDRIFFHIL